MVYKLVKQIQKSEIESVCAQPYSKRMRDLDKCVELNCSSWMSDLLNTESELSLLRWHGHMIRIPNIFPLNVF